MNNDKIRHDLRLFCVVYVLHVELHFCVIFNHL